MLIRVKVNPATSKNSISLMEDNITYKVQLKAQPIKGKANKELITFLAKHYQVRSSQVEIISGHYSQIKLIKVSK